MVLGYVPKAAASFIPEPGTIAPEAVMSNSILRPTTSVPKYQFFFYDEAGTVLGSGYRIDQCTFTTALHVWHSNAVNIGRTKTLTAPFRSLSEATTVVTAGDIDLDVISVQIDESIFSNLGISVAPLGPAVQGAGVSIYGQHLGLLMTSTGACDGRHDEPLQFLHTASTHPGFSGGPILQNRRVVGTHLGVAPVQNGSGFVPKNVGVAIHPLIGTAFFSTSVTIQETEPPHGQLWKRGEKHGATEEELRRTAELEKMVIVHRKGKGKREDYANFRDTGTHNNFRELKGGKKSGGGFYATKEDEHASRDLRRHRDETLASALPSSVSFIDEPAEQVGFRKGSVGNSSKEEDTSGPVPKIKKKQPASSTPQTVASLAEEVGRLGALLQRLTTQTSLNSRNTAGLERPPSSTLKPNAPTPEHADPQGKLSKTQKKRLKKSSRVGNQPTAWGTKEPKPSGANTSTIL
jgi:hypothetical protein